MVNTDISYGNLQPKQKLHTVMFSIDHLIFTRFRKRINLKFLETGHSFDTFSRSEKRTENVL